MAGRPRREMMVLGFSKVFSNGKIVIPRDIQKRLEIEDGHYVLWIKDDSRIYLQSSRLKFEDFIKKALDND